MDKVRLVSVGATGEPTVHVDAPTEDLEDGVSRAVGLMFEGWERKYGKWVCGTCGRRVRGPGPIARCQTCQAGR